MQTNKLKTIILRFRDLSTKDTITEHKNIINENQFVWWGWWAKPQETIPFDEFKTLNQCCNNDGLDVFLFDSGKRYLYIAKCTSIDYNTSAEVFISPDPSKTPEYYSSMKYMAWFKFEKISDPLKGDAANEKLSNYSYFKVDNFFVSKHSAFAPFYDKKIYSIDELAEQQRTIWFIRDFAEGDKSHEIHSYCISNGKNVGSDFRFLSTNNILWISDAHFSTDHHAFTVDPGDDKRLCIRLQKELCYLNMTVSHVIISGDLTFRATDDEYNMAESFINDFRSIYNLNETNFSICPGNHDLRFSGTPYEDEDKVTIASTEAKKCYVDFYRKVYGIEPTESLYSIKRLLTPDFVPVEIIMVNSCILQNDGTYFTGMGFVGNDQLAKIEEELSSTKNKPVMRILVMHHHLLPVMFSEKPTVKPMYSMMLDSEAISQFVIRNNIKVVLHGHAHKEYYAEIIRKKDKEKYKYYILGTGSAGAISVDLSDNRPNMFSTLTFSKDELVVKQFSLFSSGEQSEELHEYRIPIYE